MTAGKAATIIRILSIPRQRDPRFVEYVAEKIDRGKEQVRGDAKTVRT